MPTSRVFWMVVVTALCAGTQIPARADEFHVNGRTFTLPPGFEIELLAGPPVINRPITADFDEQGYLYVSDSSGSNDKVQKQLEEKPHRILRLEDTDGDGRYDRHTVFADHMMFPEGTMWFNGSLYVSAAPSIWKLTDTDGDGVADVRLEWFQGKTLTGCANDLHGPYLGPDGWIYWAKGAFAEQRYERPGKKPFVTRAAHIFRCRPDGSGIEPVMTGGMDNPVDVVFTPGGERIFTTTFLQQPAAGRRDGLIHAIYGGVYGKVHNVIDDHQRTSPDVMPVLTHLGPAAPCGFTRYESDVFGPDYRDNLFASLFNLHKVTRHVLTPKGASFTSADHDFLVSSDLDFHPTDVLADADGSLVVVDTGGWYKLCCPTSQLHKPDVLGAIYRVRKQGAPRMEDARGRTIAWKTLVPERLTALLADRRPAVRQRAIHELGKRETAALPALENVVTNRSASRDARLGAIWALTRIDDPEARALVRKALADPESVVRQAALHSMSVWRDAKAVHALLGLVMAPDAQNQRAAAEALGRIGDPSAVPIVLGLTALPADRALEHSLRFALIEIDNPQAVAPSLKNQDALVRRAALIALDQMENGGLKPDDITPDLTSADDATRSNALWIVGRHPEWGEAIAGLIRTRLEAGKITAAEQSELEALLAQLARSEAIQSLLADRLRDPAASAAERRLVLRAMAQAGMKQAPKAWLDPLAQAIGSPDADVSTQAVATARALPLPKEGPAELTRALVKVAEDTKAKAEIRLDALAALRSGLTHTSPELFTFLRDQVGPDRPLLARTTAADILSRARLSPEQLEALTETIKTTDPMALDRLLGAFEQSKDEKLGLTLVAALKQSPALGSVPLDALKKRLKDYPAPVQAQAEELYRSLNADAAKQRTHLEELLGSVGHGDIRRGQAVFNNQKVACVSCHSIGYLGGKVGPDLTRIGQVRSERDLLEAIAFPSASFVRSYEPVLVATKDGRILNGIVRKDAPDELVLATSATEEVHIARDDVDEMRAGTVSVMPSGLDQQLSVQELSDLVAFLRACK